MGYNCENSRSIQTIHCSSTTSRCQVLLESVEGRISEDVHCNSTMVWWMWRFCDRDPNAPTLNRLFLSLAHIFSFERPSSSLSVKKEETTKGRVSGNARTPKPSNSRAIGTTICAGVDRCCMGRLWIEEP